MNDEYKSLYKNHGVLFPKDDPTEYQLGGVSGIVHEKRNTLKDWRPFEPMGETQKHIFFDDSGCATHSAENSLELQFGFLIKSNLIRMEDLDWLKEKGYFDKNGLINFDDRFIVVLSGTRPGVGNYLATVWDAIRKFGLVPQGSTPFREDMTQKEYYSKSDFPQEAYDLGKEFLKRFWIQYERVAVDNNSILKALEHAPVHIGSATCPGWFDGGIVKTCGWNANHATVITYIGEGIKSNFDSYPEYRKKLALDYKIFFAYKGVISPIISVGGEAKERFVFTKNLKFGDYDNDVTQLCRRLIEEDCLESHFPSSPHYSPEVAKGVLNYWNKTGCANWFEKAWYRGRYFGPKTRLSLNSYPVKYPW